MRADDDLRLALHRGVSGETVAAERLLCLDAAERDALAIDPDNVVLHIVVDGIERLGNRLSLGALGDVVVQLPQARQRLVAGEAALLRSGVVDAPHGMYLWMEPTDLDAALLTLLAVEDPGSRDWFPDSDRAQAIYARVAAEKARFAATAREWFDLTDVRLSRSWLVAALAREEAAGRALLALLGQPEERFRH